MTTGKQNDRSGRPRRSGSRNNPRTIDLEANKPASKPASRTAATKKSASDNGDPKAGGEKATAAKTSRSKSFVSNLGENWGRSRERLTAFAKKTQGGGALGRNALLVGVAALLGAALALIAERLIEGEAGTDPRIAALEDAVATAQQSGRQMAIRITELGGMIETMATETGGVDPALVTALQATLADFDNRIATLEARLGSVIESEERLQTSARSDQLAQELAALETRLDALSATLQQAEAPGTERDEIAAEIDANRESLSRVQSRFETVDTRIDALSSRMDDMADQDIGRTTAGETMARRVTAEALEQAYDRGAPFADLLKTATELAGKSQDDLADLTAFATTGAPTLERLRREFDAISGEVREASLPPGEGVVGRLMQSARSLVTVRPIELGGDNPNEQVWQIADRLAAGDLEEAHAIWRNLPQPAQAISHEWAGQLEAKIKADAAIVQLTTQLTGES